MKTIQIPDELHEQLKELADEYCTQNNRHTADPLVFTIQEPEKIWGMDDGFSNGFEWADREEGDTITDIVERATEYCKDNDVPFPCDDPDDLENYHEDWIEEHLGLDKVHYRETFTYKNHFLTAKACDEHIKANNYKYHEDACSYGEHAFRNPDMDVIAKLLRTLHQSENVAENV